MIENLYLYENNFSGGLPPDLFTLPKLQKLSVYGNSLMGGPLPTKILSLGLQTLDVEDSGIIGRIPENIGSLFSLEALYLGGNDLTGSIPNLKRLTKLGKINYTIYCVHLSFYTLLFTIFFLSYLSLSNSGSRFSQ